MSLWATRRVLLESSWAQFQVLKCRYTADLRGIQENPGISLMPWPAAVRCVFKLVTIFVERITAEAVTRPSLQFSEI